MKSHINLDNKSTEKKDNSEKHLLISICLTFVMMIIECIGGWLSNSLALMADSVHMLSDVISLFLAWLSQRYSRKSPDLKRSYGYSRMQILAAFLNGLGMIIMSLFIIYSSICRLIEPHFAIISSYMISIAIIGAMSNITIIIMLKNISPQNLNIRGATIHAIGDLVCSVIAIICAVIIRYTDFVLIDTLLSIVVSYMMIRSAMPLMRESSHILLEGAPDNIDVNEIRSDLVGKFDIIDVHHIHVWMLVESYSIATMHIVIKKDVNIPKAIRQVKDELREKYGIYHITIEVEEEGWECSDDGDHSHNNQDKSTSIGQF